MTTPTSVDTPRARRAEAPPHSRDLTARRAPGERAARRLGQYALLVAPGLWVAVVVVLSMTLGRGEQLGPLLAAAPAIACVGTGRRQCIVLGSACALIALAPFPDGFGAVGERVGTALAIVVVTSASYLVAQRRIRIQHAYDQVRHIAEVTQRVLLRPVPPRIGPVATAVEYMSAATGAHVGGDFYEVIETPYGIRAILGDMRGNGLDAVSGAAALLGAFREAGAVEPALETVAGRLDAALARHAAVTRRAELTASHRPMIEARTGSAAGAGTEAEAGPASGSGSPSGLRARDAVQDRCLPGGGGRGRGGTGDGDSGGLEAPGRDGESDGTVREIRESEVWAEDFATAVLVQIPYPSSYSYSTSYSASMQVGHVPVNTVNTVNTEPSGGAAADGAATDRAAADAMTTNGAVAGGTTPAPAIPREVPGKVPGEWHGVGANEVKLVMCGHPSPYLVHGDTAHAIEPERATLPLGLGSLVAGPYAASSRTVAFGPGDALVLYTDGVSDARDRSGTFFPLGKLLDGIGGAAAPESVAGLVRSRLLEHMHGELNDDAALLVLSRV